MFRDAQKLLVENAVALYGVSVPSYYAISSKVEGFRLVEPVGVRFFANDMYIAE